MDLNRRRVVCAGEAMIELSPHHDGWDVGYGGDTLNLALHLVRLGHDVAYFTALGADPFAGKMRSGWAREGLDTALLLTHRERNTGLYAIEIDDQGERRFHYWRGESAAREMFACPGVDAAMETVRHADLLAFSLISLAILPDEGRQRLIGLAQDVRREGGKVAFDGNFRRRLWGSLDEARHWRDRAIAVADFGLPTLSDESEMEPAEDEDQIAARWAAQGCGEVVVKLGPHGCRLPDGTLAAPSSVLHPVDTSGAGDAFNAGYLGARLRGASPAESARCGQALASWVIMRRGAIPPRDHAAPYRDLSVSVSPE